MKNLSQSEIEAQAVIQDQLAEHHLKMGAEAYRRRDAVAVADHQRAHRECIECAAEYRARLK